MKDVASCYSDWFSLNGAVNCIMGYVGNVDAAHVARCCYGVSENVPLKCDLQKCV